MKFDVRYSNHPDDSKHYDTKQLREKYLIEKLFEEDEILLTYSHQDRIIAGGAMPVKKKLSLGTFKELATAYFLERREMGVINIGGAGKIHVFHIKDCVFVDGKLKQVAPGKGMFDFEKILSRIKAYDKDAYLVLEGTTGDDIVPCMQFIKQVWDRV